MILEGGQDFLSANIIDHISSQADRILSAMVEEREGYLSLAAVNPAAYSHAHEFDDQTRLLCEMPVCGFVWHEDVHIPAGFIHGFGSVKYELETNTGVVANSLGHNFWYNYETDVIACLSFAQFINPINDSFRPGDRVKLCKVWAPQLVTEITPGLYLLLGERMEIWKKLRLGYQLTHERKK